MRADIETPAKVLARVQAALADLPAGNNLVVGHYGVLHALLNQMDFFGVGIAPGDCAMLEVAADGTPFQLLAYWAK